MAALDFPSSPTLNQTYTANGKTWTWDGTTWVSNNAAISDGDKGDITVASSGASWTIDNGVVTTAKLGGDITTAGKALLDDADASAQRTTLGLGTIATQAASNVSITGGTITGVTDITVADGGTGVSSLTAYGVLCGGTTTTGAVQALASLGTSGQILTSNGASALPSWQAAPTSMVYPSAGIANSTGTAWGTSYSTSGTGSTVALATSPTLTSSTLAAGTASANTAPIKFTSGTNLTTPEAGVIEYDGTIFSATPNTSFKRAAVPLTVYTSGVGTSGITLNTNYPLFPSANDSITLPIGTYWIRVRIIVSVTGSTVASALNFSAKGDGTAVGTLSFDGIGVILTTTSGSPAPQFNTAANTPTNYFYAATALTSTLTIAPSSSNNPRNYIASGQGILKITTAGTIIPAYQFAATLTSGTTTLYAENHMVLQQLDTQSAAAFGPSGCGWG